MKKLLLLLIPLLLNFGCSREDLPEPPAVNKFAGKWSGNLFSDKFCSANGGTWVLEIDGNGKLKNSVFNISNGTPVNISGQITIGQPSNYATITGKYLKGGAEYDITATIWDDGQLSGRWDNGKPEQDCWRGSKQ